MLPVQIHLVLNHVPVTGLVFGLVFYILGIKKSSEAALLTGERIFIAMGAISIAVLASGLRSAHALSASPWLVASEVYLHQRAGILTLIIIIVLGILSGIILVRSRGGHKVNFGTVSLGQDCRLPVFLALFSVDLRTRPELFALRRMMSNIDRSEDL